jgi:mRNA turnover protein 4
MHSLIWVLHHQRVHQLQENAEKWKYCWLFQVGAMRNTHLKTVRKLWQKQVERRFMPSNF